MQLLNIQKNSSILYVFTYFLKGYVDKFLQEYILHTKYFFTFQIFIGNFLKGYVDKFLQGFFTRIYFAYKIFFLLFRFLLGIF
jgi:hypothetical protein